MPVLVLAAIRTPLGALGGALRPLSAVHLGALAIREALIRAALPGAAVDEVVMGCAFQAGMGPNPARQAALKAGLAPQTPAWTLNQLCGSGLMAVAQAARSLEAGHGRLAVAGGLESHSNAPYLLPQARWGKRMGATELRDSLLEDGPAWFEDLALDDPPVPGSPPSPASLVPVAVPGRKGLTIVDQDEWSPPQQGRASAGHAPPADGAAALVLASESAAGGGSPLGRILGFSTAASGAVHHLAAQAGVPTGEIHTFMAADHLLAVGGAPLLVDMLHSLRSEGRRYGLAALATGDGQNLALLLELC